jgi:hypothetical protein
VGGGTDARDPLATTILTHGAMRLITVASADRRVAIAAAQTFLILATEMDVSDAFIGAQEPYRCLVDIARGRGIHAVEDGSPEYVLLVDLIEALVCARIES